MTRDGLARLGRGPRPRRKRADSRAELRSRERFRDYLPAILEAGVGVDLFVYTPEEFERMKSEERPFLITALADAKLVYEG